jgi:hypothetical protein
VSRWEKFKNDKIGPGGHNAVKTKTGTCQEVATLFDMKTVVIELDPFSQLLAQEIYANYQAELRKLASSAVKQFPANFVDHFELKEHGKLIAFLKM